MFVSLTGVEAKLRGRDWWCVEEGGITVVARGPAEGSRRRATAANIVWWILDIDGSPVLTVIN